MQIIKQCINRIKSNKKLFYHCASLVYKFFNVIERNDTVQAKNDPKFYRVLDVYSDGSFDVLCDDDPSPVREKKGAYNLILKFKWFKNQDQLRDRKHDNGWRFFGGGFINVNTKEILQRKGKELPCK